MIKLQRDIFLEEINSQLESDKDIYVMSADFGAAALDVTREKFKDNFIHCGISEQAMFDIGTGLALEKKKSSCLCDGTLYFIKSHRTNQMWTGNDELTNDYPICRNRTWIC